MGYTLHPSIYPMINTARTELPDGQISSQHGVLQVAGEMRRLKNRAGPGRDAIIKRGNRYSIYIYIHTRDLRCIMICM